MNQIFTAGALNRIADDTLLGAFFNPLDSSSDLPADLTTGFSVAFGVLEAGSRSKIHLMPFVTQFAVVLSGAAEVRMKDSLSDAPYSLYPVPRQAVLTRPGTFLQFINHANAPCKMLYIVSPSYIHDTSADGVLLYDDALVLDETWETLAQNRWQSSQALPSVEQRAAALARSRN